MEGVLVILERGHGREDARSAVSLRWHEVGEHVDRGGDAGEELVGQGAEFEALRHDVGCRQQLVGVQCLEKVG